jgi:hypothetical protein
VLAAGLVQLDRAVHDAVIGKAERRLPELGGPGRQVVDLARSVEQRVLGVDVEVGAGGARHGVIEDRRRFGSTHAARRHRSRTLRCFVSGDRARGRGASERCGRRAISPSRA